MSRRSGFVPKRDLLPLLVAVALFAGAACSDDRPDRAAGSRARTAVGATEATAPGASGHPPDAPGASGPTSTFQPDSKGGAPSNPGRADSATPTTAPGSPSSTTTITTTTTGNRPTTTTTAPVGGCPDARGCPNYKLIGGRWPRDANGVATLHYRVKADGHTPANVPPVTPEQTVAAVRTAAQVWMDAVPSVRIVYDGTTTADPRSGNNVVGWSGPTSTPSVGLAGADFTPQREGPTYTGFSIFLDRTAAFTYRPCDPARGTPCDDDPYKGYDLIGILVHEFGHALGLDHVEDKEQGVELTMCPLCGTGHRHLVTLGLGDVLGARNLYPTNAPMPTLYRP